MTNIIIAGVGGQGVLLASRVLMEAALQSGYDVKESEIHGMAQRGGSVDCHIRLGDDVASPLIPKGTADFILGFEICETVRKADYLKQNGCLLVNNYRIMPSSVQNGTAEYPEDLENWITENFDNYQLVEAEKAAKKLESKKCLNIFLLGVLAEYLDIQEAVWNAALKKLIKEQYLDLNMKAFRLGRDEAFHYEDSKT